MELSDGTFARGAYKCFKLAGNEKGENAQNYAWLAGVSEIPSERTLDFSDDIDVAGQEAYFSNKCNKKFQDPAPGVQSENGGDDEDSADLGPSKPLAQANPQCDDTVQYSLADSQNIQGQLTAAGNGDNRDNCCTSDSGDCAQLLQPSNNLIVDLCGPTGHSKQCAGCADLGTVLNIVNIDCQKNYKVGGKVSIPYLDNVFLHLEPTLQV